MKVPIGNYIGGGAQHCGRKNYSIHYALSTKYIYFDKFIICTIDYKRESISERVVSV